ncbi:MAG TPA: guanylate kinase [Sphingobacterium sp.]|nr:guanylate kinase [Sphingobacterium sp.]
MSYNPLNTKTGKLIIFSAPSGAGKTTLVNHLLKQHEDKLSFSISATTRSPRENEIDGKNYYFINKETFKKKIEENLFIEYEEVYTNTYYGTLKSEVERIWALGKTVLFDIDVIGGLHLKSLFKKNALAIFVAPPNLSALKERLEGRGTDSSKKVEERLAKAEIEMTYANKFDVIIENNDLETACREAETLLLNFIK